MRTPRAGLVLFFFLTAAAGLWAAKAPPSRSFPAAKRFVLIWVPPYAVEKSRARLTESFGGLGMKDGLTHLALQFWIPTAGGKLERAGKPGELRDATVADFRDWGHRHGIRVMLCVYNGGKSWDWSLARAAFATHPQDFVRSLVAEVERLDLDGVDVDLEGNGSLDPDKPAFVRFLRELSSQLHRQGRHLTVDSFAYIWSAPNQSWWPQILPLVDGLTTMGYEEIGANGQAWRSYEAQKAAAGRHAHKLLLGLPAGRDRWLGDKTALHVAWIATDRKVGLACWDAQLKDPSWRHPGLWKAIGSIRGR